MTDTWFRDWKPIPKQVAAARASLFSGGNYGEVSILQFDGHQLPYIENLYVVNKDGKVVCFAGD